MGWPAPKVEGSACMDDLPQGGHDLGNNDEKAPYIRTIAGGSEPFWVCTSFPEVRGVPC